jgi:ketosteroid isomerase-like protein
MTRPQTGPWPAVVACLLATGSACQRTRDPAVTPAQAGAIADTLRALVTDAYDLSRGDVVRRFMSVYPSTGRVVSATAGSLTTSRDSLQMSIRAFWDGVGQHMVEPTWKWGRMEVDVLSPGAAVMSAQYTVPHWTDGGVPHVIGGVWTSVWARRGEGWRIVHEHLSDMPRPTAERIEAAMPGRDGAARQAR